MGLFRKCRQNRFHDLQMLTKSHPKIDIFRPGTRVLRHGWRDMQQLRINATTLKIENNGVLMQTNTPKC